MLKCPRKDKPAERFLLIHIEKQRKSSAKDPICSFCL